MINDKGKNIKGLIMIDDTRKKLKKNRIAFMTSQSPRKDIKFWPKIFEENLLSYLKLKKIDGSISCYFR
jgi:hypothetical protein